MNEERRGSSRVLKRLMLLFGTDEPRNQGFTRNLSREGIEIAARKVPPPKTELLIRLQTDSGDIDLHGVVRWRKAGQSMGVELHERPLAYLDLLSELSGNLRAR
ncbi:MAG: PilZ domain-containing protein [Candidatus Alcyoniella australis]|nr:PilZ domain-containing protein [Candidatus Alcyoniella australis]